LGKLMAKLRETQKANEMDWLKEMHSGKERR
jgi:hypothetical protein